MKTAPRAVLTLAAVAAGLFAGAAQAGGNAAAGFDRANTCLGCHAIPKYNNVYPTYRVPKLGGQHPEYIISALKAYRSGERPHPTMHNQALSLSDQDIEDIAAYFAQSKAAP